MLIGYAITTVITPFYALVVAPVQVLYLRFIERIGKGIRTAPRDSLVAGSDEIHAFHPFALKRHYLYGFRQDIAVWSPL